MKLVLIRHGESEWNKLNLFTGWTDVDLSEKGHEEAKNAGKLLKQGRLVSFAHFGLDCFARLLGSRAGRRQALRENRTGKQQG